MKDVTDKLKLTYFETALLNDTAEHDLQKRKDRALDSSFDIMKVFQSAATAIEQKIVPKIIERKNAPNKPEVKRRHEQKYFNTDVAVTLTKSKCVAMFGLHTHRKKIIFTSILGNNQIIYNFSDKISIQESKRVMYIDETKDNLLQEAILLEIDE